MFDLPRLPVCCIINGAVGGNKGMLSMLVYICGIASTGMVITGTVMTGGI